MAGAAVRVICLSGDAGSGKSSTARRLAEHLAAHGWVRASSGDVFRTYCEEQRIPPEEIPRLPAEKHREVDARMRARMESAAESGPGLIADGRLVGYLGAGIPGALRVFLTCSPAERARRIAAREGTPLEEVRAKTERRDLEDASRFEELYGIRYRDPEHYDLILSSERLDLDRVVATLLAAAGLVS